MRILFFVFLYAINIVFAQNLSVMGVVADSSSSEAMVNANVILTHLPDSIAHGTTTSINGAFKFNNLPPGSYNLVISYIGYKTYHQNFVLNRSLDLERILLSPSEIETDEVEVVGKIPPVVQNADTTEFNAGAFKTSKDATAEGLLTKMPGIVVQDGKVQAQGEDVKRVLVDGKPFFGDDPNAVLKNVPAEIIDKIQVFDEQSEQSRFTGYNDGNTSKTINVVTRMNIRQGTFGRAAAGYGNEEKYLASGNINFFNDDQRISILTLFNNINEQNFSSEDLLGVMSGSGGRGGRGFGGGGMRGAFGGGGGGFMGRGGSASDFFVNANNGISSTKAFGVNYSDKWGEDFELSGSYFFNRSDNNSESSLRREYFLSSFAGQEYFEQSTEASDNINHRFNMRLEYQIDTLNSILFTPRISFQQNDGSSMTTGRTSDSGETINSLYNVFNSNLKALNSSAELLYRHRFETRGRTLSLSLNGTYNTNEGDNNQFSESLYFENVLQSDSLDQAAELDGNGKTGSANLVYTEPAWEDGLLQFSTSFSYNTEKNEQETHSNMFEGGAGYELDTMLSNVYQKNYFTQSYGTGYRYQKKDFSLNAGLNYNISRLSNDQEFPYNLLIERTFESVLPSLQLRYNISKDQNLRMNYRTNNNDPSVTQLQNVLNNSNPLQLRIGNPELQQDYRHSMFIRYSSMNIETQNSFFIMMGGTFINNYIGNRTIIAENDTTVFGNIVLNQGTQITRPENLDGYFSLRSFATYGLPVNFIKSNLNINFSVNYTRTPGILNDSKGFSNNLNYGIGFNIGSNISEDLDFSIFSQSSFNNIQSSLNDNNDNSYFNQNTRLRFYWNIWAGFVFQTDLSHQYNSGLSASYDNNSLLWNGSIGKKVFSDDRGEIRFTAFDILNQNSDIQRNTSDVYYEDSRSNVLGRYFLVSFIYNIRAFN